MMARFHRYHVYHFSTLIFLRSHVAMFPGFYLLCCYFFVLRFMFLRYHVASSYVSISSCLACHILIFMFYGFMS